MNNKSITLNLHLYLDDVKENTAYENIKKLKEFGLHITATASKKVSERIVDLVDVLLYDKENDLLKGDYGDPDYTFFWFENHLFKLNFARKEKQPHSLPVLRSMIKGCEIAMLYGFDHIIRIEFDDLLSKESINWLINQAESMKEDMLFFKNDYSQNPDISVHTILYKPNSFLNVFRGVKREVDYARLLNELGIKKSITLEEFMLLMLNYRKANVKYLDGTKMESILMNSTFNLHSSPSSLIEGCLTDIMKCKDGVNYFSYVCYEPKDAKITLRQKLNGGKIIEDYWLAKPMNWAYLPINKDTTTAEIIVNSDVYSTYEFQNGLLNGDYLSTITFKN
jgi:hypothetical protein